MGLGDYFKSKAPIPTPTPAPKNSHLAEKSVAHSPDGSFHMDLQPPASKFTSSRNSISNRSTHSSAFLDDIKHEVMVNYLFQQQCSALWVGEGSGKTEGALLRKSKNDYVTCPGTLVGSPLGVACAALNTQVSPQSPESDISANTLKCAMTINSRVIKTFLQWSPDAVEVPMHNGGRIQIIPTIEDLARARKHQYSAFIASEAILVIWDDDALNLMERAKSIERQLMKLVWDHGGEEAEDEKNDPNIGVHEIDQESGEIIPEARPLHLLNTYLVSITIILITVLLGAGYRQIAIAVSVDSNWIRLAFLALTPIQIFFTLFFAQVIVGCLAQIFGPVKQLSINSKFYSARKPPRLQSATLPHITIQCPVYKEGLSSVIAPTVKSIKKAISTYELQGGSANMFINDDGLQLISEEDRNARIEYYADHSIGWVARPADGDNFVRKGKCMLEFPIHQSEE